MSNETERDPEESGDVAEMAVRVFEVIVAATVTGFDALDRILLWIFGKIKTGGYWVGATVVRIFRNGIGKPLLRAIIYTAVGLFVLYKAGIVQFAM